MNNDNDREAELWWQVWLDEIESTAPNLERATRAARQVSAAKPSKAQLRQWLEAVVSDVDDPLTCTQCQAQLPDFIAAQNEMGSSGGADAQPFEQVRTHLALCPFCMEAYAQVAEWLLAAVADSVAVSQSYPAFDFAFLPERTSHRAAGSHALTTRIEMAVAAGRRWLQDGAGGILVLFGPGLQSEPASAWAVKSADAGALLAQVVLTEDELPGWEITVAAFVQERATQVGAQVGDGSLCQLEVALYRSDGSLAGILVRIVINTQERESLTDEGGVVIFEDIPIAQLGEVVVHVGLAKG